MWFSAMVRLAVFIDGRIERYERSVFVFEEDTPAAHLRAVELGRALEATYKNSHGDVVRWRLLRVETLDALGEAIVDGREVFSEPIAYDGGPLPEAAAEDLEPGSAGVGR